MPTPVSSLIHAATLVTAGLYLLMRSSPILEYSSTALFIITMIGSLTSIFAASTGLLQNDIKRIIAMSTISQLGYKLVFNFSLLSLFKFDSLIKKFVFLFNKVLLVLITIFYYYTENSKSGFASSPGKKGKNLLQNLHLIVIV